MNFLPLLIHVYLDLVYLLIFIYTVLLHLHRLFSHPHLFPIIILIASSRFYSPELIIAHPSHHSHRSSWTFCYITTVSSSKSRALFSVSPYLHLSSYPPLLNPLLSSCSMLDAVYRRTRPDSSPPLILPYTYTLFSPHPVHVFVHCPLSTVPIISSSPSSVKTFNPLCVR